MNDTAPAPLLSQRAVDVGGDAETSIDENYTFLQPLKSFITAANNASNVRFFLFPLHELSTYVKTQEHPYTKLALGMLISAAQVSLLVVMHLRLMLSRTVHHHSNKRRQVRTGAWFVP